MKETVVKWSDVEKVLGPRTTFVYRALLARRGSDAVVAAPVTVIAKWINCKPAQLYPHTSTLRAAGFVERVRAPASSSGFGFLIHGQDLVLTVVDAGATTSYLKLPDNVAAWVQSDGSRHDLLDFAR